MGVCHLQVSCRSSNRLRILKRNYILSLIISILNEIIFSSALKRHKSKQGQSLIWNVNNGKFFIKKAVRVEKHMIKKIDQFWKYQKKYKKIRKVLTTSIFTLRTYFTIGIKLGEVLKWDVRVTKIQANVVESGFIRRLVSRFC